MNEKYIAPEYKLDAFNCPHCGAYSAQTWKESSWLRSVDSRISNVALSICERCEQVAVWVEDMNSLQPIKQAPNLDAGAGYGGGYSSVKSKRVIPKEPTKGRLIYPDISIAPSPHDDMPENVKEDFLEARTIVSKSPRGAAALLRLCVQKLMPHLGEKGKDINKDIANLVKKGLPIEVQQSLDSLRIIGNESVHPGQMALKDDIDTAMRLFELLNFIVEDRITRPKKISGLYNTLPQSKRDGIDKRDGKK